MTLPDGVVLLAPGENRASGRVILKASGADTQGAYSLRENTVAPGFLVMPHRHRATDEAWYVIEGELTFLVEQEVVKARAGGFVLVPRGVTHAFANRGQGPAQFIVLFSPPGLELMFEELLELRAAGASTTARVAAIQARYGMEDVSVATDMWPPSGELDQSPIP